MRPGADPPLVVLGDHQPPAAVSGPEVDWAVPVHVITRRDGVLHALEAGGFVAGLDRIAMYRRGRADWPARRAVESERP